MTNARLTQCGKSASFSPWYYLLFVLPLFGGCSLFADSPKSYKPLAEIVAEADRVVLYEGLPHHTGEKELLQKELAEKKTFSVGPFSFYTEPMPISRNEAAELTEIFNDIDAFNDDPPGMTKCGPYHPDYAVEFSKGDESVFIEYCFGCGECKIYSGSRILYLCPSANAETRLKKLLHDRFQNRPQTEFTKHFLR